MNATTRAYEAVKHLPRNKRFKAYKQAIRKIDRSRRPNPAYPPSGTDIQLDGQPGRLIELIQHRHNGYWTAHVVLDDGTHRFVGPDHFQD